MTNNIHPLTTEDPSKNPPPTNRLLRWPDVQLMTGICRSHAHQLIAQGKFPAPIKLVEGGRASAWVESEIFSWLEQRIADSRSTDPEAA